MERELECTGLRGVLQELLQNPCVLPNIEGFPSFPCFPLDFPSQLWPHLEGFAHDLRLVRPSAAKPSTFEPWHALAGRFDRMTSMLAPIRWSCELKQPGHSGRVLE